MHESIYACVHPFMHAFIRLCMHSSIYACITYSRPHPTPYTSVYACMHPFMHASPVKDPIPPPKVHNSPPKECHGRPSPLHDLSHLVLSGQISIASKPRNQFTLPDPFPKARLCRRKNPFFLRRKTPFFLRHNQLCGLRYPQ